MSQGQLRRAAGTRIDCRLDYWTNSAMVTTGDITAGNATAGVQGQIASPIGVMPSGYEEACSLAERGELKSAETLLSEICQDIQELKQKALLLNDLGVLAAAQGKIAEAFSKLQAAIEVDHHCDSAISNLSFLQSDLRRFKYPPSQCPSLIPSVADESKSASDPTQDQPIKIAIVSFLFNWPSTGGGNIHTAELAQFLLRAGYRVQHYYPSYKPWAIGKVAETDFPSISLPFIPENWSLEQILTTFRHAVDQFAPDYVIVTDAWNMKPHLVRALVGYRILLRFQALECLCPLNNLRLLPLPDGRADQCEIHQLRSPIGCFRCVKDRAAQSGQLHAEERALARVGTRAYHETLCQALRQAEVVLVLNPEIQALLEPYASKVEVVTWGMDPDRFPDHSEADTGRRQRINTIFQAGAIHEYIKGFHVLHAACARLWQKRRDFELVATGEPAGPVDEFTRFTGWLDQSILPNHYRQADIVVVPTIAQDGLSRTSVEAMAAARPVVASRIGGLPFSVTEGVTGILFEPGNVEQLASAIESLLDRPHLCHEMGRAGRKEFEERFAWPVVIDRYYRPLFQSRHMVGRS